jgi:hypothetical protein
MFSDAASSNPLAYFADHEKDDCAQAKGHDDEKGGGHDGHGDLSTDPMFLRHVVPALDCVVCVANPSAGLSARVEGQTQGFGLN